MINGKQHMDTTRVSNSSSNRHKPSGATIHPEPSIEVHGIGLVPQPPSSKFFSNNSIFLAEVTADMAGLMLRISHKGALSSCIRRRSSFH